MENKKVFVFGIDGAPPELIFDKWLNDLPNIKRLMEKGCYARLNSTIPPSTIIAWNSMLSAKDASEIGVFNYTFKDKNGKTQIVSSKNLKCKLIWDILGEQNKKTIALYVPLSYPVKPINGKMVSDFLTPSLNANCAYPESIKEKIKSLGNPEAFFDVAVGLAGHKGMEIPNLIKKTYEMTDMQIALLKDFLVNEDWDFFISVMIGTDRMQHMLWRHFDESHRRFIQNSPHKNALKDYYIYLDKKLGEIVKLLDKDTTIIVASDHGMIKQEGKININNFLISEGYLVLKEGVNPKEKQRFSTDFIDMKKTLAYGGGAYNARIYLNKEKIGKDYDKIREELISKIKRIPGDKGAPLDTKVYRKEEIYSNTSDPECPDLTVYFDDLRWASNPDLGQEGLYSWETAIGADSAGHSRQGCFIISGSQIENKGYIGEANIEQIAPTILKLLKARIPDDIKVKGINILSKDNQTINEAMLIDSTDGIQFKVYSNSHPKDFIIAKPKYIPEHLIKFTGLKKRFILEKCMTRFNLFTDKNTAEENFNKLKEKFPEYVYKCDKHKNWFLGVPISKIKKVYDSKSGLKELMKVPEKDLDPYLKAARGIIEFMLQSKVSPDNMGISHSTLLGNYTSGKSDIDIIVYGKDNGWRVINLLEKTSHPLLRWKTKEDWARYYRDRVVSEQYSEEEYVFNMIRKKDDGFFDGHVFSIFVVENPEEMWYNWDDAHEPLGTIKIKALVTDDYNSIVRPGFYEINDVKVLESEKEISFNNLQIKRVVTWSRPFVLQARKGDKIEACGLLEKIKTKTGEFYQIVLGYFDAYTSERGKKEYMKSLLN